MKRSRHKNIANKTKNPNDIKNYKRQRNYVINLNKNHLNTSTGTILRILNLSG